MDLASKNQFGYLAQNWTGVLVAAILIASAACTCPVQVPFPTYPAKMSDRISLYDRTLELRFSEPKSQANVLVVYATGDGGWRGLDEQIFDWICAWNYTAVGFSSSTYLNNVEHGRDFTTPKHLAEDYKTIIQFAEGKFGLPESTRIVLVGLSRGAGLAIIAAGEGDLKPGLAGVVAVALIKEENHILHVRWHAHPTKKRLERELLKIQTYEYLPRIDSATVAVIQSTHDSYLPASDARELFGPDTATKRFIPINAKNHRFTGGCLDLYNEMENSLAWISKVTPATSAALP